MGKKDNIFVSTLLSKRDVSIDTEILINSVEDFESNIKTRTSLIFSHNFSYVELSCEEKSAEF